MDDKTYNHNTLKGYNMLFYFAGSMIMHEPSEECIVDFWERGILKNLPVSSLNPNFVMAASQLRASFVDKTTFAKSLHDDFLRLFAKQLPGLALPFESRYSNNKSDKTGNHSSGVTEFYESYGWKSKFKGKIDDDHLGIELLFLTLLIDKYLMLDDEACRGELRNEIRRFIHYHILSWVPKWNNEVQANSNTLSFKGIANLIQACSEDIYVLLGQKSETSISSDLLRN
jgi:putative dimethyl sulfoxide reductase chaperone